MFKPTWLPCADAYFARRFISVFALCAAAMLTLLVVGDLLQRGDEFYEYARAQRCGFAALLLLAIKYYAFSGPALLLRWTLPLLLILASVISATFSLLHQEYTALRASGVSLPRALSPLLLLAFFCAYAAEWSRDAFLPLLIRGSHAVRHAIKPSGARPLLLVVSDEKHRVIHSVSLGHFDEQHRAYNLRIESRRLENFYAGRPDFEALTAPEAGLQPRRRAADDEGAWQWMPLQPGRRLRYTAYGSSEEPWLEPMATLITPAMLERQVLGEGVMTWPELRRLAENDLEVRLEMERRRSEPWACAAVVLAGLTAVLFLARRSSEPSYVHNAVVAVLLCAVFYILRLSFLSLGEREVLSPLTAAWLPILLTGAAAGWGFSRLEE